MHYEQFGLDKVKKSTDDGSVGERLCLWCSCCVNKGFSLCFSNWVICPKCVATSDEEKNKSRWQKIIDDFCFKCKQPIALGYRQHESFQGGDVHICKDCLKWASDVLNNQNLNTPEMATIKKNQGKGISALLSDAENRTKETIPSAEDLAALDFKMISLKDIIPDPNQPRKFFNESDMAELIDSVKLKGVIMPIVVRQVKGKYMVVCGERRYRASKAVAELSKERDQIPAVVRELSDREALELQIIENLQRKDVHPMEEAVGFKSLLDHKQLLIDEIAARVGKKEYYVKQRLKLNDLIPEWQKVFFENRISLSQVLKIVNLQEKDQKSLFKTKGNQDHIEFSVYHLDNFKGDLLQASFDLNDAYLLKGVGACAVCKFNSANAVLFPEEALSPKCGNTGCFGKKQDAHFEVAFKAALQDPTMIFVCDSYKVDVKDKNVMLLKSKGIDTYGREQYDAILIPQLTPFDEFADDNDDEPEHIQKKMYEDEVADYNKQVKEYQSKIDSAKYKKAFCISGDDQGKYLYITLKKKNGSSSGSSSSKSEQGPKTPAVKIKEGIASANDFTEEINRLRTAEEKKKSVDLQKIHAEVTSALDDKELELKSSYLITNKVKYQGVIDRGIMVFMLLESEMMVKDELLEFLKIEEPDEDGYHVEYFEKLGKISDDELGVVIRSIAYSKYGSRNLQYGLKHEDTPIFLIAKYLGVDVKKIQEVQAIETAERAEKVNKRIADLEKKKADAKKPAATAITSAKKTATKK
jgi:ParB/RepB/Spo0J family partition protein